MQYAEPLTKEQQKAFEIYLKDIKKHPNKYRIGRNEPCPCGSGKKFKKCCLK